MSASEETVNDMMEAYSLDAIDFAKSNFKVELDYTGNSIAKIEGMAEKLYSDIPTNFIQKIFNKKPNEEEIDQICKMLGGYIGETIRKMKGGEWSFNQEISPGQLVIELKVGEISIFPINKVHKRLSNGAEDNLNSFYRVMLEQL